MARIRDGTALVINAAEDAKEMMREVATMSAKNTTMWLVGIGAGLIF